MPERKLKALDDIKTDVVNIASLMATKAVSSSLNVEIQEKLIDETLREMGDDTWQS